LAYCLLLASIILACGVESILNRIKNITRFVQLKWCTVYLVLLIGIIDQSLNLYGSYRVVNEIDDGVRYVSKWLKENTKRDSIIITNALHFEDVRLYNDDWVDIYYTVQAGLARPESGIAFYPDELAKLLKQNYGRHNIFFCRCRF